MFHGAHGEQNPVAQRCGSAAKRPSFLSPAPCCCSALAAVVLSWPSSLAAAAAAAMAMAMTKLAPATRLPVMCRDNIEEKRPGHSGIHGINGAVAAARATAAPTVSGLCIKAESESGPAVVSGKCLFHVSAPSSIVAGRYKKNITPAAPTTNSFHSSSFFLYPTRVEC
ncbi:hypothetical protein IWZ03DRAFT_184654 [Phyllosticta citriasiana]|uniref:Uncharacterized protein n=1 Tax=Phyllosticta citriasiana TaxID=595635 RepID=A0ABR1KN66_9PEZI